MAEREQQSNLMKQRCQNADMTSMGMRIRRVMLQFVTNCYFIEKQSNKRMSKINTKG